MEWYALHCRSNYESRVAEDLQRFGIEDFLPTTPVKSRFGKGGIIQRPLIPGYVFARFALVDVRQRIQVMRIIGVAGIVGRGLQPEAIPDAQLEGLQMVIAAGVAQRVEYSPKLGDLVEITCGPFTGCVGNVRRFRGRCRVVLRMEMLGATIRADVDLKALRPASDLMKAA